MDLQTWMADCFDELADKRLDELLLPGSHDSAAYDISKSSGPLSPSVCDRLLAWLARNASFAVAPWTLAQHTSVYNQLCLGIRFLDLRVAWNAPRAFFVTSHTFVCVPFKVVLQDVVDFLTQTQAEVVVLAIRVDYPHRAAFQTAPDLSARLVATVATALRGHLYPKPANPRRPHLPTLREMVTCGRRVLAFFDSPKASPTPSLPPPRRPLSPPTCSAAGGSDPSLILVTTSKPSNCTRAVLVLEEVWLSAGCRPLWAESGSAEGTVRGLLRLIDDLRHRPLGVLCWFACAAVTPTLLSIVKALLVEGPRAAGLRALAAQLEEEELPRLLAGGRSRLAGVSAVCLDHPSAAAVEAVVRLNLEEGGSVAPGKQQQAHT